MPLLGKKLCKLDAICAKLQQINQDSLATTSKEVQGKDESQSVPNEVKVQNGRTAENETKVADSSTGDTCDKNSSKQQENGVNFSNSLGESFEKKPKETVVMTEADSSTPDQTTPNHSKSAPILPTSSGSSRRKSRKALIPRNISQVRESYDQYDDTDEKDELAEYEINNQNTNFPPPDEVDDFDRDASTSGHESLEFHNGDDSNSSSLSSSKPCSSEKSRRKRSNLSLGYSSLSGAPLDLSVPAAKSEKTSYSVHNGYLSSDAEDDDINNNKDLLMRKEANEPTDLSVHTQNVDKKQPTKDQTTNLKDYAETTMNELISMYGFGRSPELVEMSKQVPLHKYNEILQQAQTAMALMNASKSGQVALHPHAIAKLQQDAQASMTTQVLKVPLLGSNGLVSQEKKDGLKPIGDRFINSAAYINTIFNSATGSSPSLVQNKKTLSSVSSASSSPGSKHVLPDYTKYLKRYSHSQECGIMLCQELGHKEHYHCTDCSFQVFLKKEEMVRHYKWHKKREESLQHGFLRFSPLDDCTKKFGPCTHNGRQTHYHCLQPGCDKVYISTSDVQMHANYHRKDSAIIQEGFQRFRATEDCGTPTCSFYGQRTTHFHCRRSNCKFTFKNKADMEKHKSYHQKDEILGRDGFKKFMKYEHCSYNGCRYSKISNHIHCIRTGCNYVLHSTAQLYSHKRKHERRDFENAYRKYRDDQTRPAIQASGSSGSLAGASRVLSKSDFSTVNQIKAYQGFPGAKRPNSDQMEPLELKKPKIEPNSEPSSPVCSDGASTPFEAFTPMTDYPESSLDGEGDGDGEDFSNMSDMSNSNLERHSNSLSGDSLNNSLSLPINQIQKQDIKPVIAALSQPQPSPTTVAMLPSASMPGTGLFMQTAVPILQPPKTVYLERREKDDSWKNYLVRYTANDPCNPRCQYLYKDHYHCKMEGCLVLFKSKDGVREHARFHELQDRITPIAYREYDHQKECPEDCQYSLKEKHYHCIWSGCTHVVPHVGPTFGRLEHYRIHEYARAAAGKSYNRTSGKGVEDSGMRRRGRPPKYPKSELPVIPKVELSDDVIRNSHMNLSEGHVPKDVKVINGFRMFTLDDPCPDQECTFYGSMHYHCARPRCYTITDRIDVLNLHAKDFHSFVKILEGFEFFDRAVSCRRMHCPNNQTNRHFHCIRPRCDYSFVRHSTMAQHDKKHTASDQSKITSPLSSSKFSMDANSSHPLVAIAPATSLMSSPVIQTSAGFLQMTPTAQNIALSPILAHGGTPTILTSGISSFLAHSSSTPIFAHAGVSMPTLLAAIPQMPLNMSTPVSLAVSPIQALPASVTSPQLLSSISGINPSCLTSPDGIMSLPATAIPLTMLLQKGGNDVPQPSWTDLKIKMHFSISQNCGRPFCKLKKKDHYHCFDCNQAFSDPARLRSHIGKHGIKFKRTETGTRVVKQQASVPVSIAPRPSPTQLPLETNLVIDEMDPDEEKCLAEGGGMSDNSEDEDNLKGSSSLNLNPSTFSQMITKAQEENRINVGDGGQADGSGNDSVDGGVTSALNVSTEDEDGSLLDDNCDSAESNSFSRSGRKRTRTKHEDFVDSNAISSKQRRGSSPRMMKDDTIPPGYVRSRYNEDCTYPKCSYRQSVTHFHCMRDDCGYGFSDRSRLVQHTLRHERIDSITGGEMQQYRINQNCSRDECEFNNKMSHFHCLRCVYSCTDSSKVLTHRKQHAKLDDINSQGFQKYSVTENCDVSTCVHALKQTHYHCRHDNCNAAVLGPAQMSSHKMKHQI